MSKEAIEDYAEAIQNYFGQKRGASLIASPNDFLKIEEWFKKGIPLRAVQKGIGRHFEKIDPSRRLRAVVIRFAEGAILDEWEIMKAGGAGPTGKASPEDEAAKRKERLETFIHQCAKARMDAEEWVVMLFVDLIARAGTALALCRKDHPVGKAKPLPELAESLENCIEVYLRKNATPERMRSARLKAKRALAPYRARMSEESYRNSLDENMLATLRVELGVPKLMEEM